MTSESHPQLTEQETDGELVNKDAKTLSCGHFPPAAAELVKEFGVALEQDLSEAVAAIQTLLKFIKNCKGTHLALGDGPMLHGYIIEG